MYLQEDAGQRFDLPWGLMKELAGDCMWIPRELGLGAGTKEPGDGTCSWGFPGEPAARMLPGDGVPMKVDGEGVTLRKTNSKRINVYYRYVYDQY